MATRNRALRAIEALVAAKERAVITMAPEWAKGFGGDLDPDELAFVRAIEALIEARSLLAKAQPTLPSNEPPQPTATP